MMVFDASEAKRALGHVLATFQPDFEPGDDLKSEVVEIGQALGLLPYVGWERNLMNPSSKKAVKRQVDRVAVLVEDPNDVPTYEMARGKFS